MPPGSSLALVGENGSGKTTLIKLLTRLYAPTSGRICFEGMDLREWDEVALRERIGVIFQDFAHYQMRVGENVGVGDEPHFEDEARWREAAEKGRAAEFIDELPLGYETQLGKWFRDGRELSGGQWQKIALSRAFMRTGADVLVLDEPTAVDGRTCRGRGVRALPPSGPRAHYDSDFAPIFDGAHGRPDRGARSRADH